MKDDPIVAQVRRIRAAYARKFNYDMRAMGEDLMRRTEEGARAGKFVVRSPKQRIGTIRPAKKRAG